MSENAKLDMNLSLDSVSNYLKHLPQFKCPLCGGADFSITSSDGKNADIFAPPTLLFTEGGQRKIQEKNTLYGMHIQVECTKCGHISNLHYWRLLLNIRNETFPSTK